MSLHYVTIPPGKFSLWHLVQELRVTHSKKQFRKAFNSLQTELSMLGIAYQIMLFQPH